MESTKLLSASVVLLLALAAPRLAGAGPVVEVAISDETIGEIVHRILDHNPPEPFTKPCQQANDTCWLDHIDYALTGIDLQYWGKESFQQGGQSIQRPIITVAVPSTLYWKTDSRRSSLISTIVTSRYATSASFPVATDRQVQRSWQLCHAAGKGGGEFF